MFETRDYTFYEPEDKVLERKIRFLGELKAKWITNERISSLYAEYLNKYLTLLEQDLKDDENEEETDHAG